MGNTLITIFSSLEHPRIERQKLYPLIEVIFLTISAVISGANHFTEISIFGDANLDWLRQYLPFENGIPYNLTININLKISYDYLFFKQRIGFQDKNGKSE